MPDRIDYGFETWTDKFKRKLNENPWVPIGCVATTGALVMSAVKMKAGKSRDMQYWLRARVALQGLTLVALVVGSMAIQASRKSQIGDNAEGVPRNEAVVELLREQKKERGKLEFEERLRDAELAHAEEQAIAARGSAIAKGSGTTPSIEKPSTTAVSTDVGSSTKSRSSWTRWLGWGSSKDESSNKS